MSVGAVVDVVFSCRGHEGEHAWLAAARAAPVAHLRKLKLLNDPEAKQTLCVNLEQLSPLQII